MKIALTADTPFLGSQLATSGMGGSESSAVHLMSAMARRSHEVAIYSPHSGEETFQNVRFRERSFFDPTSAVDVLIHFRHVYPSRLVNNAGTLNVYWPTDLPNRNFLPVDFCRVDLTICISSYQRNVLLAFYPNLPKSKTIILEHGIPAEDYFDANGPKAQALKPENLLLYCSIPDRGAYHLLQLFPRVRHRIPSAQLVVTSDFSLWGLPPGTEEFARRFAHIEGADFRGKVPRAELIELQLRSKVMMYPCIFPEGFCISALECIAAGAVPVTTDYGALPSTVGESGILIPGCPGDTRYDDVFVDAVCRLLTDDEYYSFYAELGKHRARSHYTWDLVAERLESALARI